MEIRIHSAVPIDKGFEEYIKDKFDRLKKFLFDEGSAEFHIKREGSIYISEIKIHSKSYNIFLKDEDNDMNKSVEKLFDRAKGQARKMHDKVVAKNYKI
ncbi:MAG TPA: HPF/RaiA family ribosome-associated protein [bacterium]|nr:HPF/RaiA family ribosome-associated protein [bacterium]HPP30048.1 HPF/RaiA family ribosome-associated protein [bacterium]